MKQQFVPPQFIPPQPQGNASGSVEQPNLANIPRSAEGGSEISKAVAKSYVIKATTQVIISSRDELADYLKQQGLELLTSWVEFEQTKDFIKSSYVVYPAFNNTLEKMIDFLERYPQLKEPVYAINEAIKNKTAR